MRAFRKNIFIVFFFIALALMLPASSWAKVRAWQGTITIPTYRWQSDVNPQFWSIDDKIIYPYTMQDHISRVKADRTYKALFLENEYLKVTCLPEFGGRIHSVLDKTEGREMFYLNKVVKPGMVGLRGAWVSGGVEWNFGPKGHTVTNLSAVNALTGKNSDGSAYIEVSNLEKIFRIRWTVRVTLHPEKAYLDERISIFNPTDTVHPYYFWNNATFPNRPGTRFIYPMTLAIDHAGIEFYSWPIHEGKDLSWLKNHYEWTSIFSYRCAFDFFGAYDVDMDRGLVQVANRYELSGKKAWTWGNWDFGLVSQKNLTDDDGPYIEIQSGPLPTQADYGMLQPREEIAWQEWWYPVHGLGDGFEYATKDVAVNSSRRDGRLELRILATGKFPKAVCSISQEHHILLEKTVDVSPQDPVVLVLCPAPDSPVEVAIKAKDGGVLARFVTPLPIPQVAVPEKSWLEDEQLTVEQKYLKAQKFDRATERKKAREYYDKAVFEDPGHVPSLRSLAVLDIESGLYEEAVQRLEKAVDRDENDGLSWFFLGVSRLRSANQEQALRCGYRAARCFGTKSIGYDLAGRAYMRLADYSKAAEAFEKAVLLNPDDTRAKSHLLIALYAMADKTAVSKQAKETIAQRPSDLIPRALVALQSKKAMNRFVHQVRDFVGEDDFEMLETGLVFAELGLVDEAVRLICAVCVEAVPETQRAALPLYYLAYFASLKPDKTSARAWLKQAAGIYRDYEFACRPEAVEVLKYAVEENPEDSYAHLHLGNLYGNLGRLDEAVSHWTKAVGLNPSLSIAFRNLGLYSWKVENDLSRAGDFYVKAIAARPKDQTLYRDLMTVLVADNKRSEAIELIEAMPFEKMRRDDVIVALAQAYLDEQRYTDAIDLLESTPYFVNDEGGVTPWVIFNKAHLERGKKHFEDKAFKAALQDFEAAMTYPENLGVGQCDKSEMALAQQWRAKAMEKLEHIDSDTIEK